MDAPVIPTERSERACLVASCQQIADRISAILTEFGVEGDHSGMLKVWDLQVDGLPPPEPESETAEAFRAARASPPMPVRDKGEILGRARRALNAASEAEFLRVWHAHTALTDPAGLLVPHLRYAARAELCTHAWMKMLHFLKAFPALAQPAVAPPYEAGGRTSGDVGGGSGGGGGGGAAGEGGGGELRSLHVCEAPGAFIAALNHFLRTVLS
ncbi:hypothetical protein T484DRAFT_1787059 [Baffinella frigidus]|nr:hypothetical protein T484DRAFT_1787059 [Cryptophyta sp. CCMP2293]